MRWVVLAEVVITFSLFGFGLYVEHTARSADEAVGAAPLYLLGAGGIVVTVATVFVAWMWQVTFRG